jgi:hypothetical protein
MAEHNCFTDIYKYLDIDINSVFCGTTPSEPKNHTKKHKVETPSVYHRVSMILEVPKMSTQLYNSIDKYLHKNVTISNNKNHTIESVYIMKDDKIFKSFRPEEIR